jgi:hypothetical protein
MQTLIDQLTTSIANIAKQTTVVNKNQALVTTLTLEKLDAENKLESKTATLYADGLVQGSNEATRKAHLATLLVEEVKSVQVAETKIIKAKSQLAQSENTIRATRDTLYALQTILKITLPPAE